MNKLHVAIVHDAPVPAVKYGGTERVVWWLGKALAMRGHRITYIVPKGRRVSFAEIITRPPGKSEINPLLPKDVDIIHSFATLHEGLSKPLIVTIEGNGQPGERYHPNTVFVSRDHARRHGSEAFVYNGLDPEDYPELRKEKKEHFCYFLAKARWGVKNVKGSIRIAKKAGIQIKIIGGWKPSWSKHVTWLGMLGKNEKNEVLTKGSALLFPVRWHEPFGIAIIEALFTGSPVFGTPYGSLPELIPEDYGFLSKESVMLAEALKNYKNYDPERCRKYILNRFTHLHMAESYLNYYEHVLSGRTISKDEPRTLSRLHPETLLEFS